MCEKGTNEVAKSADQDEIMCKCKSIYALLNKNIGTLNVISFDTKI